MGSPPPTPSSPSTLAGGLIPGGIFFSIETCVQVTMPLSLMGRITELLGEAFGGGLDLLTQGQLLEVGHRPQDRARVPQGQPQATVGAKGSPGAPRKSCCLQPRGEMNSQGLLPPSTWGSGGWLGCEQGPAPQPPHALWFPPMPALPKSYSSPGCRSGAPQLGHRFSSARG